MTEDVVEACMWVPRLGSLDISEDRAALIRGRYQLAAVADHPDLPVPAVAARVSSGFDGWEVECAAVDRVAAALGVSAEFRADGQHYVAEAFLGAVAVSCAAITSEYMSGWQAMSYSDNVTPGADAEAASAGGAR